MNILVSSAYILTLSLLILTLVLKPLAVTLQNKMNNIWDFSWSVRAKKFSYFDILLVATNHKILPEI